MKKQKNKIRFSAGFTLIELLIVIAVIGILAGVVLVNSGSSIEKSKRASALTTVASVLPELVACQDDAGLAKSTVAASGEYVCCTTNACTAALTGHTITWPDVNTKTGWQYAGAPTGALSTSDYVFTLTKTGQTTITCSYASNTCS